jgi:hypothetical protein
VLTAQNPPAAPSTSTTGGTGNAATTAMVEALSGAIPGTR